ncbi:AMP-binding protein [Mesorhizobium sp. VK24D]|uniref:AMP-binding protein n=1 Tax=Mesorhizobium album TaxID=3072314 RepID=A0ABU4XW41_9HYPH|nr:AMP-binding protein [Mesorhizobium sp. VK24D]MDX8478921.1 AMP-binding protein [Mesorhizobium sp. VK24D]
MEFTKWFAELGLRPALIFSDREPISYFELARRIAEAANRFGSQKKLVAVVAEPTEHAIIAYLAALHGNHAVVLLPPCKPEALDDFVANFSPDIVCRRVDGRWRSLVDTDGSSGNLHPDLAVLLGTSGSTGKSQYVRLSATAIQANAEAIATYLELDPNDRAALILPFHYSYGLSILNSHLVAGASVYFPRCGASDAGFAEETRAACCTNISGVPYSFEQMELTGFRRCDLPALRFMTVAGGRMRKDLAETFARHLSDRQARFFMMYGQTEATARIAYVPPEQLAGNVGSIGIAIPGGSLWLADEHGAPIRQEGETGELVYRGPNVMMGYACERNDLAKGSEISELHTGDMATRDARGFYHVVGRRKRMSKIVGLRLCHEAIEFALEQAGISGAVVGGDDRLLALVTSAHADDQVLKVMMAASGLPRPHLEVDRARSLPRLASGKVDYVAVQRRLREKRPQPRSGVLAAFRNAFYPRQVSVDDTFEGLGGDSLLYVQLSLALERELGRAPEGWEAMPLSQLCRTARAADDRRSLDSQLALRAMSILLIVIHHATLWPIPGGAAVLVMLVGYSLARFKRQQLCAGNVLGVLRSLAAVLVPYALIVAGFSLTRGEVLWPSVFLVGNLGFAQPPHMMPYLYWFVEAYVQIVLLWVAMFCILPMRDFASVRPFAFGAVLLALSVAAKFLVPLAWNIGGPQIFTLPDVFYLTALGWCLYFATSRRKRHAIVAVVAVLCPLLAWYGGNWLGSWMKFMLVLGAVLALLYVPRITVPAWLAQLVLPVSAASYHIYLFHRIVPEWLLPGPDSVTFHPLASALAISVGMISGLVAFALQTWLIGSLARLKSRRKNSKSLVTSGV